MYGDSYVHKRVCVRVQEAKRSKIVGRLGAYADMQREKEIRRQITERRCKGEEPKIPGAWAAHTIPSRDEAGPKLKGDVPVSVIETVCVGRADVISTRKSPSAKPGKPMKNSGNR